MTRLFSALFILGLVIPALFSTNSHATETLDELYASRVIVPLVLNRERYPVYGDYIEKEIEKKLKAEPQFSFSKRGMELGQKELVKLGPITLGIAKQNNGTLELATPEQTEAKLDLEVITPLLNLMADIGVHSAILGEVLPQDNTYGITFHLINVRTLERLHTSFSVVEDKFSLESFSYAAEQAFQEIVKAIPFDGTVIKRDGYRVVIDRGNKYLKVGDTIPAFTVEYSGGDIMLRETGMIELTQVEARLSFGKIIVENKPRELLQGNKIRIPALHPVGQPMEPGKTPGRDIASKSTPQGPRRALGYVNLNFGASLVNVNSRTATGTGPSADLIYPGGNLSLEFWLTKDLFFDADFQLGISSTTDSTNTLNTNINGLRTIFGYRLPFDRTPLTPIATVKVGFVRRQFKIDNSTDANSFLTTNYSGLLVGGAFTLPLSSWVALGFDINTNLFSSVAESPLESGAVLGSSNFDLAVRSIFKFNAVVDLEARLQLTHNSAEFDGNGTRPISVVSSTQTTTTAYLGLLYYF